MFLLYKAKNPKFRFFSWHHPVDYMTFVCLPKKITESSGSPSNWHQLKL